MVRGRPITVFDEGRRVYGDMHTLGGDQYRTMFSAKWREGFVISSIKKNRDNTNIMTFVCGGWDFFDKYYVPITSPYDDITYKLLTGQTPTQDELLALR